MVMMEEYFETLTALKSYVLGLVVFNIKKLDFDMYQKCIQIETNIPTGISDILQKEFDQFCDTKNTADITIISPNTISTICKHLNVDNLHNYHNIDISYFIHNQDRENAIGFLKAYYEQNGKQSDGGICISAYVKANLVTIAEFFGIPHTFSNVFNIHQLNYYGVNVIDVLGHLYRNSEYIFKDRLFQQYLSLVNGEIPVLRYVKTDDAVTPTKANPSDVGFDLSIIGVHKVLNDSTTLYKTGIKLDIPVGYYVEIVPRSSISKSGYILANSIGIIDCSYKGELLVALTGVSSDRSPIEFPFKCCQLIVRKQVFPHLLNVSDMSNQSKRSDGGFGSSG
jgi:dUTP pyrophosphatase